MKDLIIYSIGFRLDGTCTEFFRSEEKSRIEEFAETMDLTCDKDGEIVINETVYQSVCSTPHIYKRSG